MNEAVRRGQDAALLLRDLHASSDSKLDPQAFVLRPDVVLSISKELVKSEGYYERTKKAAALALEHMRKGFEGGELNLSDKEQMWLDALSAQIDELPEDEEEFIANVIRDCEKFDLQKYDM